MMKKYWMACVALVMVAAGCKKDVTNPGDENEHDAINSVTLTFLQNGNVTGTFIAEDPDGDGGAPPTRVDTIKLVAGQTYMMNLSLKNISGSTVKDVSNTVSTQGTSHELFYLFSGVAIIANKTDRDSNNLPIGLTGSWTTGVAGTGSVQIKLMHKPLIKAANDGPNKGHTDLALTMPVVVQ